MDTAGLGTPATRTGILQTLIDRKYVRYSGKYIIPTRKGLYIYETVRNMKIAGTALTSGWEAQLARMERGKLTQEEFMKGVLKLSGEVTEDIFRKCEKIEAIYRNGKCRLKSLHFLFVRHLLCRF